MNWEEKIYENLTEGYVEEGLGAVVRAGHEKVRKFLGKNVHPSLHSKKEKTRRQIGNTVRNIQAAETERSEDADRKAKADRQAELALPASQRTDIAKKRRSETRSERIEREDRSLGRGTTRHGEDKPFKRNLDRRTFR